MAQKSIVSKEIKELRRIFGRNDFKYVKRLIFKKNRMEFKNCIKSYNGDDFDYYNKHFLDTWALD